MATSSAPVRLTADVAPFFRSMAYRGRPEGALPRGEAARIVRDGVLAAHPWLRMHTRQDRPLPAAIPFAAVQRLVAGLFGWDALNEMRGFSLHFGAVEAAVFAVDQNGRRFMAGNEVAVDRIHIPIV
jgi:hypothetical protein